MAKKRSKTRHIDKKNVEARIKMDMGKVREESQITCMAGGKESSSIFGDSTRFRIDTRK